MKTSKLLSVILVIAILTTSFLSISSAGLDSELTNSGFTHMRKLTKAEIVQIVADEKLNNPLSFYTTQPSIVNPYSLGAVRDDIQQVALNRLNAYRRLAGLNPVTIDNTYTYYAQAAALSNAAIDQMTHSPYQPSDMPNDIYKAGAKGASQSNIACYLGHRPMTGPLSFSVDLWMEDSDQYNIDRLGHRRWALNPCMKSTGFGCATAASNWVYTAMYAFDTAANIYDYDYVSWPPSGYMANDTAFFTPTHAWSISLNNNLYNINNLSQATVTLEDSRGNEWNFEGDADDDGYFNIDLGGYGCNRNAIIFRPDGIQKYEGRYTVTVEGLKTRSGSPATLTFEVDFFSTKNFDPSTEASTEPTTIPTTVPTTESTTASTEHSTDSTTITVVIPTPTKVTTEPSTDPTTEPSTEPTTEPSTEPSTEATTETTTTNPPEIQIMRGDINGDNNVNASDARLALRFSAKLTTPTEMQFKAADINGDNQITASDARKILRAAAKIEILTSKNECKHNYALFAIKIESTCITSGISIMKCIKCDATYEKITPAAGHTWKNATCINPKTCSICGITEGLITNHNLIDYICTNCGYVDTYNKNMADYKAFEKIIKTQIAEIRAEGPIYTGSSTKFYQELDSLNSEISSIRRKILALSGDNSNSAIAKRKSLELELSNLQNEVDALYDSKSRANSIDALNAELQYYYDSLFG